MNDDFSHRLKSARRARALSQAGLADLLRADSKTISRWERGVARPSPSLQEKLNILFGWPSHVEDLASSVSSLPGSKRTEQPPNNPLYDPLLPLKPAIPLVGRENDLTFVKQRLCSDSNVALAALGGLPGIGKTALSIALAHDPDIRDHFRDGILWAGLGPNPNPPGLLSRWGALLGIAPSERAALHGQEAWTKAIRSAIGSRTMLLVIDDVWRLEEALAFQVGGPNCEHLLTTRFRDIAAHVAIGGVTELQELSEEESMTLLRMLAPGVVEREEQKARMLVQAVGGLPLALTLMGNYLRKQAYSGPARRITAALERLSKAEERFHISEPHGPVETHPSLPRDMHLSLESVIAVTDQLLSSETRQALYALSAFPPKPNSFSEEAALTVIDCDVEHLDLLVDASLLEYTSSGRYTIHQTISDYARMHLREKIPHERLIHFVVELVEEHKKDYELFDRESALILRALDDAYELGIKRAFILIILHIAPFWHARGLYQLSECYLRAARTSHVDEGSCLAFLSFLGEAVQKQGRFLEARSFFQEGVTLARSMQREEHLCDLLAQLGRSTWKVGSFKEAEASLLEGLTLARQRGYQSHICKLLRLLGAVAESQSNYSRAESYLQEGMDLARQIGDREQECILLIDLGATTTARGAFIKAQHLFQEALTLARQMKHQELTSLTLLDLSDLQIHQGHLQEAKEMGLQALALTRQMQHREWMAAILITLGQATHHLGEPMQAQAYFQEGLAILQDLQRPALLAEALYEYGRFLVVHQHLEQAEATFNNMLPLIPEGGKHLLAQAWYGQACVAAAHGDHHLAQRTGAESLAWLEEIGHRLAKEVRAWLEQFQGEERETNKTPPP